MASAKPTAATKIHAVLGSDEAEIKRAAKELAQQLGPDGDFGCDIIDGNADNAEQASERIHQTIESLLTFPFFGTEKLVWLKNATFLADSQTGRSSTVIEALEKLAATLSSGIPASTRFLLSAIDVDKRRAFYKALQKCAQVQIFEKLDTGRSGWEE